MDQRVRAIRTLTILIWTGIPLSIVSIAFAIWNAGVLALCAAGGTYIAFRVAETIDERRQLRALDGGRDA